MPLDDGTDALHTDPVPRLIGHGYILFKADRVLTGVCYLQKELAAPLVELHVNGAGCSRGGKRTAGVERVFQRVGEQNAQATVRYQDKSRERTLHMQGDTIPFRPPGKEGEDQVRGLDFAVQR